MRSLDILPAAVDVYYEEELAGVRSAILWILSGLHFSLLRRYSSSRIFLDSHKHDCCSYVLPPHCASFGRTNRNPPRARLRPAGPLSRVQSTSIFSILHALLRHSAVRPRLGTESHFKIPAYGWLMKRFGNVPVPDIRRPSTETHWRLYGRRH